MDNFALNVYSKTIGYWKSSYGCPTTVGFTSSLIKSNIRTTGSTVIHFAPSAPIDISRTICQNLVNKTFDCSYPAAERKEMPSFCAVKNCEDKYTHSESVSFHNRKDLLEKWVEFASRGRNWKPSKWSAICSRHFLPDDFRNVNCRKTLKKSAIPSVRAPENDQISSQTFQEQHQDDLKLCDTSCRLCGICCRPVATFATNFEIFGMIQKCFPTLNIQLDDNLPKDMCSVCLTRLNSFSEFVDAVLDAQKALQGKFRTEKFIKPPERQLKIKQEPVVNVKQEVAENFDSFLSDELEEDQDLEQKFSFCDFPMLNTQDIINNCDIMEIINLDDPFIDIPDDENGNDVEQMVNPDFPEPRFHSILKLDSERIMREHNYAMPIECKDSLHFPSFYKTEKAEEKDDLITNNSTHSTLITAKPKNLINPAIVSESTIINSNLQFSESPKSTGNLMVTSVSDLLRLPASESNVKKPNIVVLNESIVKTASAFQLFPCSMCQSQFFSADGLSQHVTNTHVLTTPMVKLPLSSAFERTKIEKDTKSIVCSYCDISFVSIQDLLMHKRNLHSKLATRRGNKGRVCSICEKFFISRIAFNNHRKYLCQPSNSSTPNTFKCRFCSKDSFNHWRIYRNHEALCKQKKTKKSKQLKKRKKYDKEHIPVKKVANLPPANDPNLMCLGCNSKFDSIDNFRLHYINGICRFKPSADEVLAFCCTCNRPITTNAKVRSHRHFQVAKKYSCKVCTKVFATSNLLSQHRITHSNTRKHKCELCEKIFKRRGGLQQHMKGYHMQMKPHECVVCKRRYALKADMVRCKHSILKY